MSISRMGGLAMAAAMLAVGSGMGMERLPRNEAPRKRYRAKKPTRASDRSKKQFLIKGVRP